jgi:hypothetical protein
VDLKGIHLSREQAEKLKAVRDWLKARHVGQAFLPAINWPELRYFAKDDLEAVTFYKRRLPHWELTGSCYFVTFRVRKILGKVLEDCSAASPVEEVLWLGNGERFALHAYVIMPDHVHVLLQPLAEWSLAKVLQGLKERIMINIFCNELVAFGSASGALPGAGYTPPTTPL